VTSPSPEPRGAPRPRPDDAPTMQIPVPTLPPMSAPAGSLPPGSAPAVGPRAGSRPRRTPSDLRPAPSEETAGAPRSMRPPRRQPLLVQGAAPAAVAVVLALASAVGTSAFVVGLLAVQVVLVLGVLALVDAPASGGAFVVATVAIVAADAVVLLDDGAIGGLAGVVGLAVVGSLLHQLTRRGRSRVTESLADTFVVVTLAVAVACLLALRSLDGGERTARVALVAAAACLLAGRVGDLVAARPMLAVGSTRGWPGLLLGLGAGVAGAVLVAGDGPPITGTQAALLGLVSAATVAAADLAVDLGAAELRPGWRDARRIAALTPSGLLMPFALLGPIALVAGHLVLG
jgi:hypothetical protein